jgi:Domain of unknown function (DUF4249)
MMNINNNIISKSIFRILPRRPVKDGLLAMTIISFLFFTLGCEDIIVVDLNTTDPKTVIEATISDDNSPSRVTLTKSTDFYNPGIYPAISGAEILVNDSEGNSYSFAEIADGVYENNTIISKSNVEYSIEVKAEGEIYNAISTVPNKLILDSLSLEESTNRPNNNEDIDRFFLHLYFQDQLEINDYGRIKLYSNGVQLSGFTLYNDKFTDGNYIDLRVRISTESDDITLGDLIKVELMSIDDASYDFYLTANGVNASGSSGGGGGPSSTSAAPSNPVTNWSNKALGFFSAYTVSSKSITLSK